MSSFYTRKLIKRLREECGLDIPEDAQVHRTYAGYWQRKSGAWSWWINLTVISEVGSQYPVNVLAKASRLGVSRSVFNNADIHIDPETRVQKKGG